ncbi:M3 family oligoendopeptidase, partial [Enterococcus faecalis]
SVPETVSTFGELIVAHATLKEAKSDVVKINLLDTKMQNAIAMFMNIHAGIIFVNNFYEEREKGLVGEENLTELMLNAQ